MLCRITLLYGNVLGSGELASFMSCFNTRCQYIPANQSLMIQPFVQPLEHNLSQKNPIKYPSQPTLGHISVCSVEIDISPRKMDFIGLNKGRPKLEPWGVNDFFIHTWFFHSDSAKSTATTNLLNFLCCTGTSIGSHTKYILNSAKKRWWRNYIKTAHGVRERVDIARQHEGSFYIL